MKKQNYSVEDVQYMLNVYDPNADQKTRDQQVSEIASALGRKKQAIIAKLVNLKVYVKKKHLTKSGEKPMTKDQRVQVIAETIGVNPEIIESLAKANVSVIKLVQDMAEELYRAGESDESSESA